MPVLQKDGQPFEAYAAQNERNIAQVGESNRDLPLSDVVHAMIHDFVRKAGQLKGKLE